MEQDVIETFRRLAVALGIGLMVGVERGWRHREAPEGSRAAGFRTHAVIGLLGGLAGALLHVIGTVGVAALTLGFATALIAFKVLETQRDEDVSVTGTLAALLVYALGVYCMHGDLRVAAAVGVALVVLLAFKEALHDWVDKLTWSELRSALVILCATAVVLPLLPDTSVDPWGTVNPRELWLLTILVAGASFAGYIAVRVLGGQVGLFAGAAAGALVSSTVVTAELGRRVRAAETAASTSAAAAALAAAISVTRVFLFIATAASSVLPQVGPPLAAAAAAFLASAWVLARFAADHRNPENAMTLRSPLDLPEVGKFALFLGGVIIAGRLIADAFGEAGLLPFAATAGLADVDAVALAVGSLVRQGLDPNAGGRAILVAVLMNTLSKAGVAVFAGGWRYAGFYLMAALTAISAAAGTWVLATA